MGTGQLRADEGGVIDESNPLHTQPLVTLSVSSLYQTYEDSSFVTGDSPVILDLLTDLGDYARDVAITNDGVGNITVAISNDGISYSDEHILKAQEGLTLSDIKIDSVRLTWVADSSYRVIAI